MLEDDANLLHMKRINIHKAIRAFVLSKLRAKVRYVGIEIGEINRYIGKQNCISDLERSRLELVRLNQAVKALSASIREDLQTSRQFANLDNTARPLLRNIPLIAVVDIDVEGKKVIEHLRTLGVPDDILEEAERDFKIIFPDVE